MGWGERAFLTRWQLALIVLLLFLAVGTSIAVGIKAVKIQNAQQENRVTAIRELCLHDNANARHNVEFLEALGSSERTLRLGRRTFKQTRDCQAFAMQTVERTSKR